MRKGKPIYFLIGFILSSYLVFPFALKDILKVPFPSHLIVAKSRDRIAWVFNDMGRRNIWVADAPGFLPRKVTSYAEDDGQEIRYLRFTPDGSLIVFVRGGDPNREGEIPNPASFPKMPRREVWAVRVRDGKVWKIGEGTGPEVSPDGEWVIFRNRGTVYISKLEEGEKARPLFTTRGRTFSLRWSPDGSKIAFVSYRRDHSFIGVYELATRKIKWLLPDVSRDSSPIWSEDSRLIAFVRLPGSTMRGNPLWDTWLYPFSIWVVDVETGKGKKVYGAERGGGFAQYYPENPLFWAGRDYLVFYSEQDGWMHLYSLNLKTGKVKCLTPGNYEVEYSALMPDKVTVVFNSNKGDIDRRHLWTVSVSDGKLRALTMGEGIEWSPSPLPSGKFIALFSSTALRPATPSILDLKSGKMRLIAEDFMFRDFPIKELVKPVQVIFKAGDGLEIHGQLFVPKKIKSGEKHPALVFMHGGPIRQMLLGWHYFEYYHNSYAFNQYMVSRGYVVLSVNYRSGIGYGARFRTAPGQGPAGASEYQDIIAAAKYLQRLPYVDPLRIGLWGGSYGGYLTALGLARDSDLFAAGVDFHGVHDWSWRGMMRGPEDWGIEGKEKLRMAYLSSPAANLEFWTSPVLFIHGDDDRNVDFIQTTDLVQRLRKLGRAHVETLIFPDEVHDFLLWRNWYRAYLRASEFFDRFLIKQEKTSHR